ncbi:putative 2-methylcitrate dehydratase [Xylariaceae sp. FL0662B]|nr:putative 2-methylcitrate dehydratase [Xylariaceae sp. FL0662B]
MSTQTWDPVLVMIKDFVYNKRNVNHTEEALGVARLALSDALCCAVESISKSPVCRSLLGPLIPGTTVPNGVKIPGTVHRVDPVKAAFDLGTAIRFLDHNDVLGGAEWGHPADNLGALLAVSDYLCRSRESSSTGRIIDIGTLIEALMKSYEIQGIMLIRNAFNARGLDHVVLVKLASAAVVSWLMDLNEDQALAVLSHVFMDNVPLRVYRHGSNTIPRKSWAAGDACSRAVYLCMLVASGQPGAPTVLSAPKWGFYDAIWDKIPFELPVEPGDWAMKNVFFKLMAVEGHSISAVEACMQHLRRLSVSHGPSAYQHIRKVHVRTSRAANMLINKEGPLRNPADRDHCMQYVLAVALIKGSAPVAEDFFDDSSFQNTGWTESLRGKITVEEVDEFTRRYYDLDIKSLPCAVSIEMDDDTALDEILVEFPVGHVRNLQTVPALKRKFWENMRLMYPEERIRQIEEIVHNGPDTPVSRLLDLMHCTGVTTKL